MNEVLPASGGWPGAVAPKGPKALQPPLSKARSATEGQVAGGGFAGVLAREVADPQRRSQEGGSPGALAREEQKLWEAARQMEALLWQQVVREMQKGMNGSGLFPSGFAGQVFGDMFADALAEELAQGGAGSAGGGLSEAIFRQLAPYISLKK